MLPSQVLSDTKNFPSLPSTFVVAYDLGNMQMNHVCIFTLQVHLPQKMAVYHVFRDVVAHH